MVVEDQDAFIKGLQNGLGLTSSSEIILSDPQTVSEFIRKDKAFHTKCIEAVKLSSRVQLNYTTTLLIERKYKEWKFQVEQLRVFIPDLNLWESYCKKADADIGKVMRACHIYKSFGECATALGYFKTELVEYIMANEALANYMTQKNIYNF